MIRERRVLRGKESLKDEMGRSRRSPTVFGEWRQREGRGKALLDVRF